MGRLLRHAPPRTRGAKAAFFTTEGQEHLVRTGVTAQADKAMGQDAALQVAPRLSKATREGLQEAAGRGNAEPGTGGYHRGKMRRCSALSSQSGSALHGGE